MMTAFSLVPPTTASKEFKGMYQFLYAPTANESFQHLLINKERQDIPFRKKRRTKTLPSKAENRISKAVQCYEISTGSARNLYRGSRGKIIGGDS